MYSTYGYNKCWKQPQQANDRRQECHLTCFMYGTFQLPASTASFLQTFIGAFFSCCTYNSICKQSYLHSQNHEVTLKQCHKLSDTEIQFIPTYHLHYAFFAKDRCHIHVCISFLKLMGYNFLSRGLN